MKSESAVSFRKFVISPLTVVPFILSLQGIRALHSLHPPVPVHPFGPTALSFLGKILEPQTPACQIPPPPLFSH